MPPFYQTSSSWPTNLCSESNFLAIAIARNRRSVHPVKSVTVATFHSLQEAESLRECLVAAGIATQIQSRSELDQGLDFTRVSAGVYVAVPRSDFEAALRVVEDWNVAREIETALPGPFGPLRESAARHAAGPAPRS